MSFTPIDRNRTNRFPTLGAWWIVYGVLSLIEAALLFVYSGTATAMFGALLSRVPSPFALMSDFHIAYGVIIVLSVVCGIAGILAGIALGTGNESGRALALTAAFLALWHLPFGLTLGVYTLVALLPWRAGGERAIPLREAA